MWQHSFRSTLHETVNLWKPNPEFYSRIFIAPELGKLPANAAAGAAAAAVAQLYLRLGLIWLWRLSVEVYMRLLAWRKLFRQLRNMHRSDIVKRH
jgi:hypothetical protein